ncbi:MAG: pectin acetylesterase-family hydrolase [Myxococcota bacterium]
MHTNLQLFFLSVVFVAVLPVLYGQTECDRNQDIPTIIAPAQGEVTPSTGLFTATVLFNTVLTVSSLVELEIQTNQGATIVDVTPWFLPEGQSNFAGQSNASANLDAVALGLVPGPQSLVFRLDSDGVGEPAVRITTFTWNGAQSCEEAVSEAAGACFLDVSDVVRSCYLGTGSACPAADATVIAAENQVRSSVTGACTSSEVQSLGYGGSMTADTLADRLIESCKGNAATIAARIFGGPQGKVLADATGVDCMDTAYDESASFLDVAYHAQKECVLGATCDLATTEATISTAKGMSIAAIDAACTSTALETLVGLTAGQALDRVRTQSECMVAAAHGNTEPLALRCAPGNLDGVTAVQTNPPGAQAFGPGIPTQVMLEEAAWGTRCGDGSPYYFWVEMPPVGQPTTNIHMYAKGGGACFSSDCDNVNANRFQASNGNYQAQGILNQGGTNSGPGIDPYHNWAKVTLEYCTQDVYIGAGVSQDTGSMIVERYGAVNIRAAMQVVRNLVAKATNDQLPSGYRPDLLRVVFSGNSAGAFGVTTNMHYVLDELRWRDTTFAAGAGTNANAAVASSLGALALETWGGLSTLPPYCLEATCAGPAQALYAAHSARLLATPGQQLLVAHNQIDNTQRNTQMFADTPSHVNALREVYCDTQGLPGVHWFLSALPQSAHGIYSSDSTYTTLTAAGLTLSQWTTARVLNPADPVDAVDEGTLVTAYPGVVPFPCTL